jgi:regulator of replication initiation timing
VLCRCCWQEVQQRKAAQKEADKLRTEVDRLKPQLRAANSKVAELQAANAALRVSVSELKQRLLLAADGIPVEPLSTGRQASGAGRGPGQDEVAALQQHLSQSEAEATQLRQQLSVMERQLAHRSSSSAGDGQQDAQAAQQLVSLQQQVSALQQENQELRHELGAFDPAFFEELEDLKHSHHQLQQKATAQAKLIRQLQHQLTHAGSNSQRVSSSGIGPEGSSGSGVGGRSTRLAP